MTLEEIYNEDSALRDYQRKSKLDIYKAWNLSSSVLFQMPTGTGKTRVFSSIINDIQRISIKTGHQIGVLVLAHREELIEQIDESLGLKYHIAHGIIKAGFEPNDMFPVQVGSVQTLHRRLDKYESSRFSYIIIDEAHHALARTYKDICKKFPKAKLLGVTATPCRLGKGSLKSVFGTLVMSPPVSKFIDQGYLSKYKYYSISPISSMQKKIDEIDDFAFDGDYSEKAMMNVCNTPKIRADIIQSYLKYVKGKKGIVYTINQEHNRCICEEFEKIGVSIASIDSKTPTVERKNLVSKFRLGKIDVLCNVNIFSEGFDCPDVEFILLARPTCSLALYLQQVGRGLRPHPGKSEAIILDNVGAYNKFGLPSAKRQWRRHFEGLDHIIRTGGKHQTAGSYSHADLSEGDEEMKLIFSSERPETQHEKEMHLYHSIVQTKEVFPFGIRSMINDLWDVLDSTVWDYIGNEKVKSIDSWIEDLDSDAETFLQDDDSNKVHSMMFNYYRFQQDGKYGIIYSCDNLNSLEQAISSGEDSIYSHVSILLEPIYDEIGLPDTSDDYICKKNCRYGVIEGRSKKEIVPFEYEALNQIGYRTYICKKDQKLGLLSSDELILPIEYQEISYSKDFSSFKDYVLCRKDDIITEYHIENGKLVSSSNKFVVFGKVTDDVFVSRITKSLLGISSEDGFLISTLPMQCFFVSEDQGAESYYAKVNGHTYKLNSSWQIENEILGSELHERLSKAKIKFNENSIKEYVKALKAAKSASRVHNKKTPKNIKLTGLQLVIKQNTKVKKLTERYYLVQNNGLWGLYDSESDKFLYSQKYDSIFWNYDKANIVLQSGDVYQIVSLEQMAVIGNRYGNNSVIHGELSDKLLFKNTEILRALEIIWLGSDLFKVRDHHDKWGIVSLKDGFLKIIKPNIYTDIKWNDNSTKLILYQEYKRPRLFQI